MKRENSHPGDKDEPQEENKGMREDFQDPLPVYDVPVDQGWAWVILFSTSTIGLFVIGGIKSFGVLLMEFSRVYRVPKSQLTIIQSITGFFFLSLSPLSNWLCERYTHQKVIFVGGLLASSGLILSSLAPSIEVMYFTYGILTGFGFGLSFPPSVVICTRQFNRRRGMANGINMAGSAMGGICVPILMQVLIDNFGLNGCMLILGSIMAHICPCALLLRPAHKYPLVLRDKVELNSNGQPMEDVKNKKYSDRKESILIETSEKKIQDECLKMDNEVRVQLIKKQSPLMSRHHQKVSESSSVGASIAGISSISLSYQSIPKEVSQIDDQSFACSDPDNKSNKCCEFFQNLNFSLFKRLSFCLIIVAFFFLAYSYHSIFIILPSYGLEQGLTTYQSMFLIPAFGGVDVIGRLIAGFINDKCVARRKEIFIVYSIVHGIGYLLVPIFNDFSGILVWCTAFGIFTGGFNGTFVIMLVDCVGIDLLPSAWGFACLSVSVSLLINPVFSGGLMDISGSWTASIRVGGSFALISAFLLIIEAIYVRGRKTKSTEEKEVECESVS